MINNKEARVLDRLLTIMNEENRKPYPFTARWARAWHWYYEVLYRNTRGEMLGQKARSMQVGYDALVMEAGK